MEPDERDPFIPQYTYHVERKVASADYPIRREDLSPDQISALLLITDLVRTAPKEGRQVVTFGGVAGSGKSSLIPLLADSLEGAENIAFACPTGKAVNVLSRKLNAADKAPGLLGTIHSLIYVPVYGKNGRIISFKRRTDALRSNVTGRYIETIIVDEASMMGTHLRNDLAEMGCTILAVGDHYQLTPVGDTPILAEPDARLEVIHRQAENSAILRLSKYVRQNGRLPREFQPRDELGYIDYTEAQSFALNADRSLDSTILVRTNKERNDLNALGRTVLEPLVGDTVVCLRNAPPIFNGMQGTIEAIEPLKEHWYDVRVSFPAEGITVEGACNAHQFQRPATLRDAFDLSEMNYPRRALTLLFDFGSALTVHKAQGSQWKNVLLYPKRLPLDSDEDYARWLYTAITRASTTLKIVRF